MPLIDHRFISPSVALLAERLAEAVAHAGLSAEVENWSDYLSGLRGHPEGFRQWGLPTNAASLAWWTDAGGRRHFRVRASDGDMPATVYFAEFQRRAPLWHVYPERTFRRRRGEVTTYLVYCDCGWVGTAEKLGWMGDRCTKCQEGSLSNVTRTPGHGAYLHRPDVKYDLVAFSSGNRYAAFAGDQPFVDVWDRETLAHVQRVTIGPGRTSVLAFTNDSLPDLAVCCEDRLLRLVNPSCSETRVTLPTPTPLRGVVFVGRDLLAMIADQSVEFWGRKSTREAWQLREEVLGEKSRVAVSPCNNWVAVASLNVVRLWERSEEQLRLHWMFRGRQSKGTIGLRFHYLLHTTARLAAFWYADAKSELQVTTWEVDASTPIVAERMTYAATRPLPEPFAGWVASADLHSLHFDDTNGVMAPTQIEAHPVRRVAAFRFSPDGRTLAVIDDAGRAQLWPWRALVNA